MGRTGEHVRQPGLYTTQCCSYENGLGEDQQFPVCGRCGRATDWRLVTPGGATPDDRTRAGRTSAPGGVVPR
jgi:hypothetical protein